MAIKLTFTGFDDLLKKIEKAGGNIQKVSENCMKQSAEIMEEELKNAMRTAGGGVSENLINRMPKYKIESSAARVTAKVGYPSTSYNPNNLSDYHKAIFANYGTPHRKKHGQEKARGFVTKAKKSAKPKIKAQQEKALNDILKDLSK